MQLAWCRIWTSVVVSTSYDDNHYTTGTILSDPTNVLRILPVGRDPKNPTTSSMVKIQLSTSKSMAGIQFSACMIQFQSSTDSFKIHKFSAHLFWVWHHPHSSLISCLGFIMSMVIVISFSHERKTVANGYASELLTEEFIAQPKWMIKYN